MIECEDNFEDYSPPIAFVSSVLSYYAVTSRLRAQDSVTDVSNPFSRYRTQWGKSPRAVAGMEWEEIGLTLDT